MYNLEYRLGVKAGYHTPSEAKSYYGKYSRDGVTWHWWNSPDKVTDGDHNNIVNYILGKMSRGAGSVNYVLSNSKITILVNPDNVAWASQKGNPTTISVELSPHLNGEGYKKAGWLFNELEGRYGKVLKHYKHSEWFDTQCPGTIDINRIKKEANNWKIGAYNPKPAPKPTPVPPTVDNVTFHLWKEGQLTYLANKQPTYLYNLNAKSWDTVTKVKPFNKGDKIDIVGNLHNIALNRDYYITRYSFDNKVANGFHPKDLDVFVAPRLVPEGPKTTEPTTPQKPTPKTEDDISFIRRALEAILKYLGIEV